MSHKCHFYLTQGLATSTRKVYASAQRCFLDFCAQDNSLFSSGSALPASEDVLIHFCSHLADTLHQSSIRVYLSAVRSLHIDEALHTPLVGCLGLQCVLQVIKRHQGSSRHQCQPITMELMHIIFQSLNFSDYNHTMCWAACCIGFFGFLRAGEFTVNSPFIPDIHLAVSNVQVNPGSFRINVLRRTPFVKVAISTLLLGNMICVLYVPLPSIYMSMALPSSPLFLLSDGTPPTSPMVDIQYSTYLLHCWGPRLLHRS